MAEDIGNFLQSNLIEIVESERQMVLSANDRYGEYYKHARNVSIYLTQCVKGYTPELMIFGCFHSLVKNHHMLSLLSTVRLHKVQATMNLRQVLEAGVCAGFAIEFPEKSDFLTKNNRDEIIFPLSASNKHYKWIEKHHPGKSQWIKSTKSQINMYLAHANITNSNIKITEEQTKVSAPFFDEEDSDLVKLDLWQLAKSGLVFLDLFYLVNKPRQMIDFNDDTENYIAGLQYRNTKLLEELKSIGRFKPADAK